MIGAFGCHSVRNSSLATGQIAWANIQVVVSVGKSSAKLYVDHGSLLIASMCTKDSVGCADFLKDSEREFCAMVGISRSRGCSAFYVPVEKAEQAREAMMRLSGKYDIRVK